ncbi:ABC transporter permease [Mesorhizobium sp. VK24D]|uniref:ABC transporter permease n=1 Tax=Mesorhizobium album TaxID=3072314 RepID=A0ABU4YC07_9HYPH|nr:ABC transporter permease [Mesorhizobium sp. VK24D]MDX8483427.1 ABC transporter permease [Mesorhizobium sp. VK24D]
MSALVYASSAEKVWYYVHRVICGAVILFLVLPIVAVIPLSFNSVPFFTYPMSGFSFRWYEEFFVSSRWQGGLQNSIFVAAAATLLSTVLGTLAALGLSRPTFPWRTAVMSIVISPMIVPTVITGVAGYFFYAYLGLVNSYTGLILAHTTIAAPFVVITVSATLVGFDYSLVRAAAGLGAPPVTIFFKIVLPLIFPGMIAGSLFAFATSFDEVVIALFIAGPQQRTLPLVMFSGIREQISPTILATAAVLVLFAIAMLTAVELLRRRSERLRGIQNT